MDIFSDILTFIANMLGTFIPLFSEENRLQKKKTRLLKKQKNLSLKLDIKALEESINQDKEKIEGIKNGKN